MRTKFINMKYDWKTTILLASMFFISQIFGLFLISRDIQVKITPTGEREILHEETVLGPRPELVGIESFLWLIGAIAISTSILLLIIWIGEIEWWKILFSTSVFLCVALALGVFLPSILAYLLAFLLVVLRFLKPNFLTHNLTQILTYSGIAILLVPLFDIKWMIALLLVISAYDIFAVYFSKHMVKLALFQAKSDLFAGISIPHESRNVLRLRLGKKGKTKRKKVILERAIIGGGDVAFPLLFSGVLLEHLIKTQGLSIEMAFLKVLIVPLLSTLILFLLLVKGERQKFYPGMPFLTIACLISFFLLNFV